MALRKSAQVAARVPAPSARDRSGAVTAFAEFTTVAGSPVATDVIEMIPWPAGTVPTSLRAAIGDLDTGVALTLDFGVISGLYGAELDTAGAARTCGTEFGSALTTGQAGGSVDATAAQLLVLAPSQTDRSIGFRVQTAATGLIVGAKIRVAATFVAAPQGVAFV